MTMTRLPAEKNRERETVGVCSQATVSLVTESDETPKDAVDVLVAFKEMALLASALSVLHGVFDFDVEAEMWIEFLEQFLQRGK